MNKILWVIALATCGLYICGQIVDPDLWWHITVGRWILGHAALPHTDQWTMFAYGESWRAYSWLFEIIVAPIDSAFGPHGLWIFKLLIALILALSLGWVFSQLAKDYFIGALLGIVTTAACFNNFTLRPQSIVWILYAWLIYLATQIAERGIARGKIIQLAVLFCLWANIHFTTMLGLGSLFLWIAGTRGVGDAVKVTACGFLATLITPYLGGEWLTFFSTTGHPFQFNLVAEFQPANIMQHSTAFLLILVTLILMLVHMAPLTIDLPKHVVWIGYTFAGLAVVKFLPFACISLSAAIALSIGRLPGGVSYLGNFGEGIDRLRKFLETIPREGLSFLLICWCIVLFMDVWRAPLNKRIVPVEAFDQIAAHDLKTPLLVGFGTGGYMMYRFSDTRGEIQNPAERVPIDGRTNLISPELWTKFQDSFEGKEGWHEILEVVKPQTVIWKSESPFVPLLMASNKWCRVFRSGVIGKDGYSLLLPYEVAKEKKDSFSLVECAPR